MNDDLDARIAQLQGLIGEDEETLARAQQLRGGGRGGAEGAAGAAAAGAAPRFAKDSDDRSIFILGLPKTDETPEEVAALFHDCGPILKVTLLRDKATQQPKGAAYVEFATFEAAGRALDTKNNILFRNAHPLTVSKKRSFFVPGGPAGGRGGRGRGRGGAPAFGGDPMAALMGMMGMMAAAVAGGRGGRGMGRGGVPGRGMAATRGGAPGARGGFSPFQ